MQKSDRPRSARFLFALIFALKQQLTQPERRQQHAQRRPEYAEEGCRPQGKAQCFADARGLARAEVRRNDGLRRLPDAIDAACVRSAARERRKEHRADDRGGEIFIPAVPVPLAAAALRAENDAAADRYLK